jgi:FKBP-type peptidyl-prolyl cis-trans isomerase
MRRTIAITTIAALSLAACGSSDEAAEITTDSAPEEPAAQFDTEADGSAPEASSPSDEPVVTEPASNPAKPEVELPTELPTELVRTVLSEGTGDPAEEGDTVVVDYVGVRSSDGEEFDNSYDRGQTFPVVLGSGSVIQGWEDGLVGSRTGERVQLDIPSELAYGDQARSDVILADTPLTFVIDVREVIEGIDPADIPDEPGIPLTDIGVTATEFAELEAGDGDALELGDTALIRYVYFRADNGVALETNWSNEAFQVPYNEDLLPGLLIGMEGMQVGDRRAITIPPDEGFGPEGNPPAGLPAGTDIVFLIELVGLG